MRRIMKTQGEKIVKGIKRTMRKHFPSEEKIRIVLDGLRGEDSVVQLCRREAALQRHPSCLRSALGRNYPHSTHTFCIGSRITSIALSVVILSGTSMALNSSSVGMKSPALCQASSGELLTASIITSLGGYF